MNRFLLTAIVTLLFLSGCVKWDKPDDTFTSQTYLEMKNSFNDFSISLLSNYPGSIGSLDSRCNMAFFPLGIENLFGMVINGADGKLRDRFSTPLHLEDFSVSQINEFSRRLSDSLSNSCEIANSFWVDSKCKINDSFIQSCRQMLSMHLFADREFNSIDLAKDVSTWINNNTNGIFFLYDPAHSNSEWAESMLSVSIFANPYTRLYFANAACLKSNWDVAVEDYGRGSFLSAKNNNLDVNYLSLNGNFSMYEDEQTRAVTVPMNQGAASLILFLPTDPSQNIVSCFKHLNKEIIDKWVRRGSPADLQLIIPKFEFGSKWECISGFSFDRLQKSVYLKNVTNDTYLALDYWRSYSNVKLNNSGIQASFLTHTQEGMSFEYKSEYVSVDQALRHIAKSTDSVDAQFLFNCPFGFVLIDNTTGCIIIEGRYSGE